MTAAYRIELWRGRDGLYWWRVKHRNGQIVLISEGYRRRSSAIRSAQRLIAGIGAAQIWVMP